jgi:hypothetical protein
VTKSSPDVEPRWRQGRKVGRTLYVDDVLVGLVDTPELAREIVEAMNRVRRCVDCGGDPAYRCEVRGVLLCAACDPMCAPEAEVEAALERNVDRKRRGGDG